MPLAGCGPSVDLAAMRRGVGIDAAGLTGSVISRYTEQLSAIVKRLN